MRRIALLGVGVLSSCAVFMLGTPAAHADPITEEVGITIPGTPPTPGAGPLITVCLTVHELNIPRTCIPIG